jgi:cell surface protein SprA
VRKYKLKLTNRIKKSLAHFKCLSALLIACLCALNGFAQDQNDSLRFPINENKDASPNTNAPASIDLNDPSNIERTVEYDPEEGKYYFYEKIGDQNVRTPTSMTFEEYMRFQALTDEQKYWKQRMDALSMFNQKPQLPAFNKEGVFDRLFGGTGISVKPQGNVDLTFGGSWQNMKNPTLTQRAQKYGIFDFDMQMNVNLLAQIGDKMKLNISNNTAPSFGEQNMQKLEYTGKEDEIIKKIEAGNVSFPLRSSLISGVQSLFGLKAQLQFGKLWVTGVVSQQRSQRKSVTVQGGGQFQAFEVKADAYEENKNFLLSQYFYENYDYALQEYPRINSQIQVTKVEVWVTNRTGATQGVRDILAFMDLGEANPYLTAFSSGGNGVPDNRANRLYDQLLQNPSGRNQSTATQMVRGLDLVEGQDFQRNTMRQLNQSEFFFQPQLGYITLNTQVNPDDVLAVAFRYTYKGNVYQVGEFAEEMSPDTVNQKVMFLKLLKGTANRPGLPIWNLMMKNVYSLGAMSISKEDFRLNIMYQDPGGGEKRYLPEGSRAGEPIISLLNLDRLNPQNDPMPDGIFDFVEGITINPQQGKIIFPVLQPFGNNLKPFLDGDPRLERKYLYQILYDSTKIIAQQFQQNNRFILKGNYKSSSGTDIYLGGYNIPQGSVSVTAGGNRLTENTDYQVDYSLGRIKILNQGILSSGVPINIQFEDNAAFGFLQQNFMGARLDYFVNDKLTIGGTYMKLTERPFTQKVTFGDDPIKNTVLGLDANYQSEFPALSRWADKLPIYSTTAPSLISASGEVAGIFPGHHNFINIPGDEGGTVFVDDFEGTSSSIDLRFPSTSWTLSSVPVDARNANGNVLFPEAELNGDLRSGQNRAKIAWYNLEPTLVDGSFGTPASIKADTSLMDYWRIVQLKEVFPTGSVPAYQTNQNTFDIGFYPSERGPYNFDATNIDPLTGALLNPASRWGGIQRAIDINSDFEAANVEYVTFWMLDPFIYNPTSNGGDLYINLGNVSEDVLKDSRLSFENGIPYPKDYSKLDNTVWGYVPRFQQQITRAFDNSTEARQVQDVGYDELDDEEERRVFEPFLNQISAVLAANPAALQKILDDPASDNFRHFRGDDQDQRGATALQRYKDFNSPQGNSPVAELGAEYTSAGTAIPESEDINRDNTLSENESYYQYRIRLKPNMQVGESYIVNKQESRISLGNGRESTNTWYQFKVPIRAYDHVVGGIGDFRAIRFIRMFATGFTDSVIMRFAQLQLDRNQWRRYQFSLIAPGENIPEEDQLTTSFAVTTVSIEQNSDKNPIPYVMPPGISRQSQPNMNGQNLQLDERSLALQVCGLKDGDARAVFKDVGSLDMRQNKRLKMFIHAESVPNNSLLADGDLYAFIRIGSDFINNYYEYRIPLKITALAGTRDPNAVWPEENRLDIELEDLVNLKMQRNEENVASYIPYHGNDSKGNSIVIIGNPNIGEVKNIMMGVLNPKKTLDRPADDGMPKCVEVWFNELRMTGLEEKPAYAASGQVNLQIADLGNVHLGASMHTIGYGNIDQKVNQRMRDNFNSYDISTNLQLGKLMPRSWGVQLPFYFGYSQSVSNPLYDPYDKDVELSRKLEMARNADSARKAAQTFSSVTSFNFSNVRFTGNPENQRAQVMPWSLKNFDLSYAYNRTFNRNPLLESDEYLDQRLGLGYAYNIRTKFIEPFKRINKSTSKWWAPIKDFNFNLLPSNFTFRTDLRKVFGETIVRTIGEGDYQIPPTYYKNFTWARSYALRWEFTKSLSFNYQANNQSRIDEPYGRIDSREKRDTLWSNFSRFGRNTQYNQSINATYNLPTTKFPILDWTRVTASYSATYDWTAASLLAKSMGNTIGNTQIRQINGELNFAQLYNKSRHLKAINQPPKNSKDGKGGFKTGGGLMDGSGGGPTIQSGGAAMLKEGRANSLGDNVQKDGMNGAHANSNSNSDDKDQKNKEREERRKRHQAALPPRPVKKEISKNDVPGHDTMSRKQLNEAYKKLKKAERQRFRKELSAWKKKRASIVPEISDGARTAGRLATMLKRATLNYNENFGTMLPGYMDSTRFFGINTNSLAPGMFAFGYQPSTQWLDDEASAGRISRDSLLVAQMRQNYSQTMNIAATLEPFPDFRIDLTWMRQFSKNHSETFKDVSANGSGEFQHLNPYDMGSFSISYIAIGTMFSPSRPNELSRPYQDFLDYRKTISARLGRSNPYTNGTPDPTDPEYTKGYGRYSQDVLIPAFIAAYTGKDPKNVALIDYNNQSIRSNPFRHFFPLPNWKVIYNGLGKLPAFSDRVSNFAVTHNYTGNMSMNSFVSSFYFRDLLGVGFPSFIDSNSNNYIPFFQVPNMTINEQFGPLLGFDVAFKNSLTIRIQFNKQRQLSLSLLDYQVSETKSSEIVIGGGYRLNGLNLPFTIFGTNRLKNDINIRFDFGYRSDLTTNSYLAQNVNIATRGQNVLTISPSIDYIINDNLQLRLFYDRRQTVPAISTSYPITTTRAGLTLRFLFTDQ